MVVNGAHNRGMRRHRAAAQIVAEAEAAGDDDQVDAGDVCVLMPDHFRPRAERGFERDRHIALPVDTGKDDDARGHGVRERIMFGSLARLMGGHNEHNQEVTSAAAARPALSARSQN